MSQGHRFGVARELSPQAIGETRNDRKQESNGKKESKLKTRTIKTTEKREKDKKDTQKKKAWKYVQENAQVLTNHRPRLPLSPPINLIFPSFALSTTRALSIRDFYLAQVLLVRSASSGVDVVQFPARRRAHSPQKHGFRYPPPKTCFRKLSQHTVNLAI